MLDRIFASLMFFTRLPWWRLRQVPTSAFVHVADLWPLAGWLTGGTMCVAYVATFYMCYSPSIAAVAAIVARLLLTGALHEDGLADFCDGFGGGTSRERTLAIMKDSHIGSYGVLGLVFSTLSLWVAISNLDTLIVDYLPLDTPDHIAVLATGCLLLFADVAAKSAASLVTGQLPYARTAESAKNGVVYVGRTPRQWAIHGLRILLALSLPVALCWSVGVAQCVWLLPAPFVTELLLMSWMRRRIGGYTGDCCGALFVFCELTVYLALSILFA